MLQNPALSSLNPLVVRRSDVAETTKVGAAAPAGPPGLAPWKKLVAGSIAGTADVWACHGLDRVKTHLQANPGFTLTTAFQDIWKKGGIRAVYEGIWPMTAEAIAKVGARYFAFNSLLDYYKANLAEDPTATPPVLANMACGAGAGVVESVIVVIPCELLKVRHMTQAHNVSFAQVFSNVLREEGVAALYKGGSATLLRQVTNHMVRFPVFYSTKQYLQGGDKDKVLPWYMNLGAGAFAGTCSTLINTPLDTIKTRMQSQGASLTFAGTGRQVIAESGVAGLWAGVGPRVLRVAPGQAITWAVFEKVVAFLGRD